MFKNIPTSFSEGKFNARTLDLLYETLNSPECNNPKKTPVNNIKAMANLYMTFAQEYRPYWLMLFNKQLPEARKSMSWYQERIDNLFLPLEILS